MSKPSTLVLLLAATAIPLGGCGNESKRPVSVAVKMPTAQLNVEQQQRRERTRSVVEPKGIPFNRHLPGVELESQLRTRSADEVVRRAIALTAISAFAQSVPKEQIEAMLKPLDPRTVFSPKELALYDSSDPSDADRRTFSWNIEGAAVLLWAVGLGSEKLIDPDSPCDVPAIANLITESGLDGLVSRARLRSTQEILDALDLHYCYHWAVVEQVQINNRPPPGRLIPGITYERLRALNWLTRYMDAEWDDVSTDT